MVRNSVLLVFSLKKRVFLPHFFPLALIRDEYASVMCTLSLPGNDNIFQIPRTPKEALRGVAICGNGVGSSRTILLLAHLS